MVARKATPLATLTRLEDLERRQLNTAEKLRAVRVAVTQNRRALDALRAARIEEDTRQMMAEVKALEARLLAGDAAQADLERRISAFELLRLQKRHPVG